MVKVEIQGEAGGPKSSVGIVAREWGPGGPVGGGRVDLVAKDPSAARVLLQKDIGGLQRIDGSVVVPFIRDGDGDRSDMSKQEQKVSRRIRRAGVLIKRLPARRRKFITMEPSDYEGVEDQH